MKNSEFQFKNPELVSLHFSGNEDFSEDSFDEMIVESETIVKKHKEKNLAVVYLQMKIGKESNDCPFFIEIVMKSDFQWSDDIPQDLADKLLSNNAPSVLLSYIRPIVSLVTSSSSFKTLNLPFMDMSANKTNFEEKSENTPT